MQLTKFIAIALAVVSLTAGAAAAMSGNAPDHAGSNDGEDEAADEVADGTETDVDSNETAEAADSGHEMTEPQRSDNRERQDPPVAMPSQVPDRVSQIHDQIRQFLNGELDGSLGKAIGDMFAGVQGGHGDRENGDAGNGIPA